MRSLQIEMKLSDDDAQAFLDRLIAVLPLSEAELDELEALFSECAAFTVTVWDMLVACEQSHSVDSDSTIPVADVHKELSDPLKRVVAAQALIREVMRRHHIALGPVKFKGKLQ